MPATNPPASRIPADCPACGARRKILSRAIRSHFAFAKFECEGEFVAFGKGELKNCKTGRWSKVAA